MTGPTVRRTIFHSSPTFINCWMMAGTLRTDAGALPVRIGSTDVATVSEVDSTMCTVVILS